MIEPMEPRVTDPVPPLRFKPTSSFFVDALAGIALANTFDCVLMCACLVFLSRSANLSILVPELAMNFDWPFDWAGVLSWGLAKRRVIVMDEAARGWWRFFALVTLTSAFGLASGYLVSMARFHCDYP